LDFALAQPLELLEKIGQLGLCRKDLVSVFGVNRESAMRRAALYLRVSTLEQTTDSQERELRAVAERMGCEIVAAHRDNGISGAKGRNGRPGFDALCKAAARREFHLIMAWSVDRLGRSLQDLVGFLSEIHALRVDLYLHQQGIDTTTPGGKAMFQMCGVFAEFERAMIAERVRAGIARAKGKGKHCGRPRITKAKENAIQAALAAGKGICRTARDVGVGVGTVQRIKAAMVAS
jgi:DNA invertase Pin-like site-specific DNA recombinase